MHNNNSSLLLGGDLEVGMKYKIIKSDLFINKKIHPEGSEIDLSKEQIKGLEDFLIPVSNPEPCPELVSGSAIVSETSDVSEIPSESKSNSKNEINKKSKDNKK